MAGGAGPGRARREALRRGRGGGGRGVGGRPGASRPPPRAAIGGEGRIGAPPRSPRPLPGPGPALRPRRGSGAASPGRARLSPAGAGMGGDAPQEPPLRGPGGAPVPRGAPGPVFFLHNVKIPSFPQFPAPKFLSGGGILRVPAPPPPAPGPAPPPPGDISGSPVSPGKKDADGPDRGFTPRRPARYPPVTRPRPRPLPVPRGPAPAVPLRNRPRRFLPAPAGGGGTGPAMASTPRVSPRDPPGGTGTARPPQPGASVEGPRRR